MHYGAGVALLRDQHVLLLRNPHGMWELPGGAAEPKDDGDVYATAERELFEETGYSMPERLRQTIATWRDAFFLYYTFVFEVDELLMPVLSHEHVGFWWVPIERVVNREDLHPGVREVLRCIV